MSKENIERVLDELIKEAEENPDWKAVIIDELESARRNHECNTKLCDLIKDALYLLKEQKQEHQ